MQVLEKIQIRPLKKANPKIQAIIFNNPAPKHSYHAEILGRSLSNWVAFACGELSFKIIDWDGKESILDTAKRYINKDYSYTLILLSITPLISNSTIKEIIEYCIYKNINLCKLPVGYVVKNDYILSVGEMSVDSLYSQNLEDFFVVESKKQYSQAEDILQDRINSFHLSNGVDIKRPKSVYIEPEVDIESGVTIFPGNTLKGQTVVSSGVILKENNVIENSKIGKDSCISGSQIIGTIISNSVYISSFCEVIDSLIGRETTISSGCKIYKYKIDDKSTLKANTVLGENNDSDSGARKPGKNI